MNYQGVIIEESLTKKDILQKVKILSTKIEKTTEEHETPWLTKWTLHTVEVPEEKAETVAKEISQSLDNYHDSFWYADYKNDKNHYIIFNEKIFKVDLKNIEQYEEVKRYGMSLGIPEYQLDFED